jgi:hypothetical protein
MQQFPSEEYCRELVEEKHELMKFKVCHDDWDTDIAEGNFFERVFAPIIAKKLRLGDMVLSQIEQPNNKNSEYDFKSIASSGFDWFGIRYERGQDVLIEFKMDKRAANTNNIAIEYGKIRRSDERRFKSGLETTKSDFWVHVSVENQYNKENWKVRLWVFNVYQLKKYLKNGTIPYIECKGPYCKKTDCASLLYVIPVDFLINKGYTICKDILVEDIFDGNK